MSKINQSEINDVSWRACDTFRGVVDPSDYKNYILVMLFWKYVSDVWRDHRDRYMTEYGGDGVWARRGGEMSIEIDVLNGDASWPRAEPLMNAVWPADVVEKLSWGHIKWAHADLRVLIDAPEDSDAPEEQPNPTPCAARGNGKRST